MPGRSTVARALRHPPLWSRLAAIVALSVGFAMVAGPIVRLNANAASFLRQMAVPLAMLALVSLVAIRHERKWRRTTGRLADVLRAVRLGQTGRDEIDRVLADLADKGELARMAEEVELIVRDAREAHRLRRETEVACERRVVRTTDALSREIGQLKQRAGRDALTGLGNRLALDEALPRAVAAARRSGTELSAIMVDVDRFKSLNDTLGHAAGDAALRDFAELIRGAVREEDAAFRYGGDEFVLLLGGCDRSQARARADRLSRLADDLASQIRGLADPPGLSCGVSALSDLPADAGGPDLLVAADADAYRVKRLRRRALRPAA